MIPKWVTLLKWPDRKYVFSVKGSAQRLCSRLILVTKSSGPKARAIVAQGKSSQPWEAMQMNIKSPERARHWIGDDRKCMMARPFRAADFLVTPFPGLRRLALGYYGAGLRPRRPDAK